MTAAWYARDIIKGRWPEAEHTLRKDEYHWFLYQTYIKSLKK
jgi:hypothetical protein